MDLKWLLVTFNEYLTLFIIFPFLLILSIYLSVKLRFLQLSKLKMSFVHLFQTKESGDGNISHYEAISAVLAGNFGTGNISGMAVAITSGGPGALVWMWMTAFLGAIIQYASCLLAVKYRTKNQACEYVGGPMYYLRDGLGLNKLAMLFSFFTLFGALTIGNLTQVNSIILPLKSYGYPPLASAIVLAFFAMLVILGGVKRIAKFASVVVPIKAAIYLGAILVILLFNYQKVLPALGLMLSDAFDLKAASSGVLGYGIMKTITTGFDRGIFATDAGTGIVPILQAGAKTKNPVIDGVVTFVAPVLVMIVCTATGLVLIVTGAYQQPGLFSTNMVAFAFEKGIGHQIGSYFVSAALMLFAYTTLIAWACCGERAAQFIFHFKAGRWFKAVFISLIPIGAMVKVDWAWLLADIAISLMLLVNLLGIAGLSKEVVLESIAFFPRKSSSRFHRHRLIKKLKKLHSRYR